MTLLCKLFPAPWTVTISPQIYSGFDNVNVAWTCPSLNVWTIDSLASKPSSINIRLAYLLVDFRQSWEIMFNIVCFSDASVLAISLWLWHFNVYVQNVSSVSVANLQLKKVHLLVSFCLSSSLFVQLHHSEASLKCNY